jgi:hypothetical protein
MGEYQRRIIKEKSKAAQTRAMEAGRWPVILIPGLRRSVVGVGADGAPVHGLPELDPDICEIVREAFRIRAREEPIHVVRSYLCEHGIDRSYHGTSTLLSSRQAVGELRFGEHFLKLDEPHLIDAATFDRVQRMVVSRGRRPKSERLLARLGVLRCDNCGARMVVGSSNNSGYWIYRCPPTGDCERRVTISAEIAEGTIAQYVKDFMLDETGKSSLQSDAQRAATDLEQAHSALDGAIRAFSGLDTEPAAIERLADLTAARNEARDRYERLSASLDAQTLTVGMDDWDTLSLAVRRKLVRLVIRQARVSTEGRGADRIAIERTDAGL